MDAPASRRRFVTRAVGTAVALATGATVRGTARTAPPGGRPSRSIDSCATIDAPGRYDLTRDVARAGGSGPCIEISADDVHLDGQGHVLGRERSSASDGVALLVTGDDVVVRDLVVSDWPVGIRYEETTGGGIFGTGHRSDGAVGIELDGAEEVVVSGNETSTPGGRGIALVAADRNTISRNAVCRGDRGIHLVSSDRNALSWNDVTATAGDGIAVVRSSRNRLEENTVRGAGSGVVLVEARGNALTTNEFVENRDDGIVLRRSSGNALTHNAATDNGADGVLLAGGERNRLARNVVQRNGDEGIELRDADENTLIRNLVCDNDDGQILVGDTASGNELVRNGTACRTRSCGSR